MSASLRTLARPATTAFVEPDLEITERPQNTPSARAARGIKHGVSEAFLNCSQKGGSLVSLGYHPTCHDSADYVMAIMIFLTMTIVGVTIRPGSFGVRMVLGSTEGFRGRGKMTHAH